MIPNYAQGVIEGNRNAWTAMLRLCLSGAGVTDTQAQLIMLLCERNEAIRVLREVCGEYGDNEWGDRLALADIIDKHLARHLSEDFEENVEEEPE